MRDVLFSFVRSFDDDLLVDSVNTQEWELTFSDWGKLVWFLFLVLTFYAKEDVIFGFKHVGNSPKVLVNVSLVSFLGLLQFFLSLCNQFWNKFLPFVLELKQSFVINS